MSQAPTTKSTESSTFIAVFQVVLQRLICKAGRKFHRLVRALARAAIPGDRGRFEITQSAKNLRNCADAARTSSLHPGLSKKVTLHGSGLAAFFMGPGHMSRAESGDVDVDVRGPGSCC